MISNIGKTKWFSKCQYSKCREINSDFDSNSCLHKMQQFMCVQTIDRYIRNKQKTHIISFSSYIVVTRPLISREIYVYNNGETLYSGKQNMPTTKFLFGLQSALYISIHFINQIRVKTIYIGSFKPAVSLSSPLQANRNHLERIIILFKNKQKNRIKLNFIKKMGIIKNLPIQHLQATL